MKLKRILSVMLAVLLCVGMLPVSVYAEVTATYAVTVLKAGGGAITGEGSYTPGEQVTITATPDTANGYCAAGWELTSVDGGAVPANNQKTTHTFAMPKKDVTITVTFVQHSYISHTNQGDGTHDVHCIFCGDVQTASTPCVDVHSGGDNETPDGWCDKCSIRMPGVCFVEFDPNGGVGEMDLAVVNFGETCTLPANGFTLAGYTFRRWSVNADGSGTLYQPGENYTVTGDTVLYAVWQSNRHDDDYYDPLPGGEHISVGVYDAILRDTLVFVGTNSSISGTLDLGETRAEAIRLPADAVKASTGEDNSVTIKYPGGTAATITGPGFMAAEDALLDGEDLQLTVKQVGAAVLPEELIAPPENDEPYADDYEITSYTAFIGEVIFTHLELFELGVIGGNDESISWRDMKLLYHYMTTEELKRLYHRLGGGRGESEPFEDWLDEMIERDLVPVFPHIDLLNRKVLNEDQSNKLYQLGVGMYSVPSIGQLRQLCLSMDQLRDLRRHALYHRYPKDHALLAWIDDAIAHEEQKLFPDPTYIAIGGERGVFVAAVEADVKAVERAGGSARAIELRAGQSDAVAWSATIAWPGDTQDTESLRAYKVLEDGGLVEKAVKVTTNADGTLTASALSNGNSTYIFVWMPNAEPEPEPEPERPFGFASLIPVYRLYFDTNGGSKIATQLRMLSNKVDLSRFTPTRAGYTFAGWFADPALTVPITEPFRMRGNRTVYAGWVENEGE